MNRVRFLSKIILAASFALAMAFTPALAQLTTSIGGSVGYTRLELDGMEDYPFGGVGFEVGADALIPLTDVAKFGVGASISYLSVSAKDEYEVELTVSGLSLDLSPYLRLAKEEKTYVDVGLHISIPLQSKMTVKVPGYGSQTENIDDTETFFGVGLFGRYDFIGVGIGKDLTGSDGGTILSASIFVPLSENLEIGPSIGYSMGKDATQLAISAGFEYTF